MNEFNDSITILNYETKKVTPSSSTPTLPLPRLSSPPPPTPLLPPSVTAPTTTAISVRPMTKKRVLSPPLRRHLVVGLKAVVSVSVLLLLVSFSLLRSPPAYPHHLPPFSGPPKLAFLFLARSHLALDILWDAFFQSGDPARFSIYIHSSPGFVFDAETTRSRFFYGRELKDGVQVVWGEASMIKAERLLFRSALEDPANQRFVLLSDSCIPLYNFSYVYGYLMSSSKSFVDSFINPNDRRYNPKMSPVISKDNWRKGSQWITLIRKHVEVVVADHTIFSAFEKHCKRRLDPDLQKNKKLIEDYCASFLSDLVEKNVPSSTHECVERSISFYTSLLDREPNCIPDEHYVQTLFSYDFPHKETYDDSFCVDAPEDMIGLDDELERRTLTFTSWNETANKMEKQGWHPLTFTYATASPQQLIEIKKILKRRRPASSAGWVIGST